jgi:hypothetical protein
MVFTIHFHDTVKFIINPLILVALLKGTKLLRCFPSTFTSGCENYSLALKHSFKLCEKQYGLLLYENKQADYNGLVYSGC